MDLKPKADYLFECSWEVCNKVGGIYTVIASKAHKMVEAYGDKYYLIGPFFQKHSYDFQEKVPNEEFKKIFEKLKREGIICHYGKWLVKGEPQVILVDFNNYLYKKDEIKKKLWEDYKIDSLNSPEDFNTPVVWGTAVGRFVEEFIKKFKKKVVIQHHEFLCGGCLTYLKSNKINVGKVFTTHATVLGRALSSNNFDLYGKINEIDVDKKIYELKIQSKHLLEKACAQNCDVFTTVSEITGIETEHFLGRKPDLFTPNGINLEDYPTLEEISIKHRKFRERIKEFSMYFFFPYYHFDLNNTLIYLISGRYEFRNKGIDMFIDALGKLNEALKNNKSSKTILAFIFIPSDTAGIKADLLENKAYYEDVEESVDNNIEEIRRMVISDSITQKILKKRVDFDKDFLFEIRRKVLRFLKKGKPDICTHDLHGWNDNLIIKKIIENKLLNNEKDKVKIIFYPIYLTGADRLLDLDYTETLLGSHLTVFPSYYEPWGYTPLEANALAIASVTTDLAGYGRFVSKSLDKENPGIFVLNRFGKDYTSGVENLFSIMYKYSKFSREMRIKNKLEARRISYLADWKNLVKHYIEAQDKSIEKVV